MNDLYPRKYAVATKYSDILYLLFEIKRYKSGDIYIHFNKHSRKDRPHSTYHATGQVHYKRYNIKLFPPRFKQPPNEKFCGTETIITTSVRKEDGRVWNKLCLTCKYQDIMEINDNIIIPEFGYQFIVDLVEPDTKPWVSTYPYARVIQQQIFKDNIPWIVASLYEMSMTPYM